MEGDKLITPIITEFQIFKALPHDCLYPRNNLVNTELDVAACILSKTYNRISLLSLTVHFSELN